MFLSLSFNQITTKSFGNSLAYSFVILYVFFFLRSSIQVLNINTNSLSKIVFYSTMFCFFIIILDWILVNIFGIMIRPYYINLDNHTANMYYFQKNETFTVAGVAEEPGSMAILINAYAMISLDYIKTRLSNKTFYFFLIFYIISLICIWSIAAIAFVIISFIIFSYKKLVNNFRLFLILIILFFLFYPIFNHIISGIINEFMIKLFSPSDSTSSALRLENWQIGLINWLKSPILGNGPGFGNYKLDDGYISFFITVLSDLGILALLTITIFFYKILKKILSNKNHYILGIGYLSVLLHLLVIGDFYHFPFWVVIMIVQLKFSEENYPKRIMKIIE